MPQIIARGWSGGTDSSIESIFVLLLYFGLLINNRLLTMISKPLRTLFFVVLIFLRVSVGDLTRLAMLLSGSKQHS